MWLTAGAMVASIMVMQYLLSVMCACRGSSLLWIRDLWLVCDVCGGSWIASTSICRVCAMSVIPDGLYCLAIFRVAMRRGRSFVERRII